VTDTAGDAASLQPDVPETDRDRRKAAIGRIEAEFGSDGVITYITSTRGNLEVMMAIDIIPRLYTHLESLKARGKSKRVCLYIHSNGGDGVVPWRMVSMIREYAEYFTLLVPHRAFSAATLLALGADKIVMHPMGMLGPIDPTITTDFNPPSPVNPNQKLGISVEDVTSYITLVKEDVGIGHEDELVQAFLALANQVHPLALGTVKRSTLQSRLLGAKLLRSRVTGRLPDHENEDIVRQLTSELYYHGHPISRREAHDELGLTFVANTTDGQANAMWDLYRQYAELMLLEKPFQPFTEAIAVLGATPGKPAAPNLPAVQTNVTVPNLTLACLESSDRFDAFECDMDITITRDFAGNTNATFMQTRAEWSVR
jgi:Serine dehydrogenase proteinase